MEMRYICGGRVLNILILALNESKMSNYVPAAFILWSIPDRVSPSVRLGLTESRNSPSVPRGIRTTADSHCTELSRLAWKRAWRLFECDATLFGRECSSEIWYLSVKLNCITSQKPLIFVFIAVRNHKSCKKKRSNTYKSDPRTCHRMSNMAAARSSSTNKPILGHLKWKRTVSYLQHELGSRWRVSTSKYIRVVPHGLSTRKINILMSNIDNMITTKVKIHNLSKEITD
jgi:hypothetical protein